MRCTYKGAAHKCIHRRRLNTLLDTVNAQHNALGKSVRHRIIISEEMSLSKNRRTQRLQSLPVGCS